jgi:UTP--glucose-1-phosphate uridylyltransferase
LGHAILCAKHFVGDEPFAVLLGDDLMKSRVPVTKQLIEVADRYDASVVGVQQVSLDDISRWSSVRVAQVEERVYDVLGLKEKPKREEVESLFAILGRYVLTSEIFSVLENTPPGYGGEIQLTDALSELVRRQRVMALDFEGIRYDTGNICGYLEANIEFSLEHPDAGPWLKGFIGELGKRMAGG